MEMTPDPTLATPVAVLPANETMPWVTPINDTGSALALGIAAAIGTVWWIVSFFVLPGVVPSSIPISGLWASMFNDWMTVAYFSNWVIYLLISFIEMVAWFVYLAGYPTFMLIWTSTVNFWGCLIIYVLPWMFAVLDIALATLPSEASWFIFGGSFGVWLVLGIINILFTDRFIGHAFALMETGMPGRTCDCTACKDVPEELRDEKRADELKVWIEACEQRCRKECPAQFEEPCPLQRKENEPYAVWGSRCSAVAKVYAKERLEESDMQ
jgi:hypothetical protein